MINLNQPMTSKTPLVFVDVETTGLSPERDVIIEVACRRVGERSLLLSSLVQPGRPIPEDATRVHGITDAIVEQDGVAPEVLSATMAAMGLFEDALIVAHNVTFDVSFLAGMLGASIWSVPQIDTFTLARHWDTAQRSYGLQALRLAYDLPVLTVHRAMGDIATLQDILTFLIEHRTAALGRSPCLWEMMAPWAGAPRWMSTLFAEVYTAICEQQTFRFWYTKPGEQKAMRTITPERVIYDRGVCMVCGLDMDKGATRTFRVDRMM